MNYRVYLKESDSEICDELCFCTAMPFRAWWKISGSVWNSHWNPKYLLQIKFRLKDEVSCDTLVAKYLQQTRSLSYSRLSGRASTSHFRTEEPCSDILIRRYTCYMVEVYKSGSNLMEAVCLLAYICDIKVTQKVQSEGLKYKPLANWIQQCLTEKSVNIWFVEPW